MTCQLILLPGLACDHRLWTAQGPALPAALRPVVSSVHARHDSIGSMAAALLREHAGPLVLGGASLGGMIALEAARQAPQRIAGLALLGTSARAETPEMRLLRADVIELFGRGDVRDVIEPSAAFAFHRRHARDSALVQGYIAMMLDAGAAQLMRQNRALMLRPDATRHLHALRCPVLVVCGDSDRLTPPGCSRDIAAGVPRAELVMLPECGHMLTLEQPEAVNAVLARWLAAFVD